MVLIFLFQESDGKMVKKEQELMSVVEDLQSQVDGVFTSFLDLQENVQNLKSVRMKFSG